MRSTCFEGLLYVAPEVFEDKTGAELITDEPHPEEPTGHEWNEDDENSLAALCPELWKRFGD